MVGPRRQIQRDLGLVTDRKDSIRNSCDVFLKVHRIDIELENEKVYFALYLYVCICLP